MQNKVLSAHRLKSGNFSSTHFKIAKHGDFADILPFDRFTPNCNAVEDADIILCTLEAFPSASAVNRGVPVILVDPDPRPSLSAELIEAVSCPEVKVCLRQRGFKDTASYYRCFDYYSAVREAAKVGQPPDPFPVFSDERIGNVVRKLRFLIPPSSFVDRLDAVDSTQRVKFYDVCVVDIGSTTDLKRSLSRVVGPEGPLKIRSITSSPFYQPSSEFYLHTFRAADVVVASESFSRVDFVALAAGCLLIKPECSNVLDYCDTYSIRNPNLIYCDPCYRDIEACLNEAFTRKACPKFIDECRAKVEESDWARKFQRLLVDVLDGKERLGSFTKVTPLV